MTLIYRSLSNTIREKLQSSNKGIVIYGARQVGKTTLVNETIKDLGLRTLTINADQSRFLDILSSRDLAKLRSMVEGYELLFIDEAQRIPEIDLALKIILDNLLFIKVLVTSSSSLDLASKRSEPLTGRIWSYRLYPISFLELAETHNHAELDDSLEERLIHGSYPEIFSITSEAQKREYLQNLSDGYLYRDLLEFGKIKNSPIVRDMLKLLAFQVGSQVSLTEIGSSLGMNKDTVSHYIDLLEKSFVIFRLKGLSRNLRKEVVKLDKIYFYDLGIRNILIDNLKPLKDRIDSGQLWENFLIIERMKLLAYKQDYASSYFWRTYTGAELDYVEEKEGKLYGYEFKLKSKKSKPPASWFSAYPGSEYRLVNRDNYLDFILGDQ
jgi:predicted AAA+ superfamily ATPase